MTRGAVKACAIRGSLGVESYDNRRERASNAREAPRLTGAERADLDELWGIAYAALGVRSAHGAVQDRMRRSPPRDQVRNSVIDELKRAGGRAPEGRVYRILIEEGVATRYEIKRAIQLLGWNDKVTRVPVEMPKGNMDQKDLPPQLTHAQNEWTGFELRLFVRERGDISMRLALATVSKSREERWREQDDALERECHMIHCGDDPSFAPGDEPELHGERRAKMDRATRSLAKMEPLLVKVLKAMFVDARPRETDVEAVVRCLSVTAGRAGDLIADAYTSFRSARRTVLACSR